MEPLGLPHEATEMHDVCPLLSSSKLKKTAREISNLVHYLPQGAAIM